MEKCPYITMEIGTQKYELSLERAKNDSVHKAREITAHFFKKTSFQPPFQEPLAWAFYDRFFLDIALPLSRYQDILSQCREANSIQYHCIPEDFESLLTAYCLHHEIPLKTLPSKAKIRPLQFGKEILALMWRIWLLIYSFATICRLALSQRLLQKTNRVAIWTGDYLSQGSLDPRLGNLESLLFKNGISPVAFIRSSGVSNSQSIKNYSLRKCPGIYYEQINHLIPSFTKGAIPKGTDYIETCFNQLYWKEAHAIPKQVRFWKRIFKTIHFDAFIPWFLSSRTSCLVWAAKNAHLPSIGFMHGMSVLTYMGHEFMPEYKGPPIGPDYFGVWSEAWKKYFLEKARIYNPDHIEVSGPLKNVFSSSLNPNAKKTDRIQVFIVSEGHLPIQELVPYLEELLSDSRLEITFKIRPFGKDKFWEDFKRKNIYPDSIFKINSEPTPGCFSQADIVIGTHSTAILEATFLKKPFLLLNTEKWGDYFDVKHTWGAEAPFWVESPSELLEKLNSSLSHQQTELLQKINESYFGSNSGAQWVVDKIYQLKEH